MNCACRLEPIILHSTFYSFGSLLLFYFLFMLNTVYVYSFTPRDHMYYLHAGEISLCLIYHPHAVGVAESHYWHVHEHITNTSLIISIWPGL